MRLSICIPTYNFGKFIGETLSSIIPQMDDSVEIVILDGASSDNTPEVVRGFQEKSDAQIRYIRRDENGGFDRDTDFSVRYAQGEYVFLLSSDDVLLPGSVVRILEELKTARDCYICGSVRTGINIKEGHRPIKYASIDTVTDFDFTKNGDRHKFFSQALTSHFFFSYLSGLVVLRSRWMTTPVDEIYFSSCYAHVARLFGMMKESFSIRYLPEPFLLNRSGNDSFSRQGKIHRMGISVFGYNKLADDFFGNSSYEAKEIRRVIRGEVRLRALAMAKGGEQKDHEIEMLDSIAKLLYQDKNIKNFIKFNLYKFLPKSISKMARSIYENYYLSRR